MECELRKWKGAVFEARHKFYELSYFTTVQLLVLRRELGTLHVTHDVPPNVLALLQSISSQIQSENIRRVVREVADGRLAVELVTAEENEQSMKTPPFGDSTSMFEVGGDNEVWPTKKEEDLNAEEKSIMSYVVQKLNCSKMLVLKAFEECPKEDMNRYKYLKWCNENVDVYKFEDEDGSHSDDCDIVPIQTRDETTEVSGPTRLSYLLGEIYAYIYTCM